MVLRRLCHDRAGEQRQRQRCQAADEGATAARHQGHFRLRGRSREDRSLRRLLEGRVGTAADQGAAAADSTVASSRGLLRNGRWALSRVSTVRTFAREIILSCWVGVIVLSCAVRT